MYGFFQKSQRDRAREAMSGLQGFKAIMANTLAELN
jgi:hypothetical protein